MIMHSMDGWQGLRGWQWLFLIEGAPALLFAIVVFFFLKDTPASAPWLSLRERNLIEADLEADRTRSGGGHHSFMDAWRSPRFYLLVGMGVALLAGVGSLIRPVIVGWLNEHTQTLAAGQYYLAALMIVGAVTVVAIGHHNRNRASAAPQLTVAA
jgi:MFS family permease